MSKLLILLFSGFVLVATVDFDFHGQTKSKQDFCSTLTGSWNGTLFFGLGRYLKDVCFSKNKSVK